ncbi:hypothetical protein ACPFL9_17365 [Paenarthrobacter sp. NyZ202]|uniref:LPXTG cell wall anchor domain-containing protein n=1 Tax=Paenarthrobacter sp. NyZ202 TaxID=3402689 RepID=UPI003CF227C9
MNRTPLVRLLLALVLGTYGVSIFMSNGNNPAWWSTVSGVIAVVGAVVMFARFLLERRSDRSGQ